MSIDNRTRAQWREAFEQCQAHARKMRKELADVKAANADLAQRLNRAEYDRDEAIYEALDGCLDEHSPGTNPRCCMTPIRGEKSGSPDV